MRARVMLGSDLDAVAAVERSIYPFPWTRGNFADSLAAGHDAWIFEGADPTTTALPGHADAAMLGYAVSMWIPDEVHLLNLSVVPTWQHRGFGRAMLHWLMKDAAVRGAHGMMLEVRPSNEHAIALYRSSGFTQIGIRRRYYPAEVGREDARVLFRSLLDE